MGFFNRGKEYTPLQQDFSRIPVLTIAVNDRLRRHYTHLWIDGRRHNIKDDADYTTTRYQKDADTIWEYMDEVQRPLKGFIHKQASLLGSQEKVQQAISVAKHILLALVLIKGAEYNLLPPDDESYAPNLTAAWLMRVSEGAIRALEHEQESDPDSWKQRLYNAEHFLVSKNKELASNIRSLLQGYPVEDQREVLTPSFAMFAALAA